MERVQRKLMRAGEVKAEYGLDAKTLAGWPEMGLPLKWVELPGGGTRKGERRYDRASLERCLEMLSNQEGQ